MKKSVLICVVVLTELAATGGFCQTAPTIRESAATAAGNQGITREQADAILNELRQIRILLQTDPAQPARPSAAAMRPRPPQPTQVKMTLPSQAYSLGRADAPITVVEFADFQCPFCRRFNSTIFAELKKQYIDTGKVRFISRDMPLPMHSGAMPAAEAALCAGEQGKFWEMRDLLMATSAELSSESILSDAQQIGLAAEPFQACLTAEKHKAEIERDSGDATALGLHATPSFVIGQSAKDYLSGEVIVGAQPVAAFDSAIKRLLVARPADAGSLGSAQR